MLALFIMALPCIGFIMVIVWAFVGDNESRKNYFRACIAWFLILTAIWAALMVLGFWPHWPEMQKQVEIWLHQK